MKKPKMPAARKTVEQLKTSVWPDRESAMRDLKTSHLPERRDDYELREYRPGSWQLVPPDAPSASGAPIREDRVLGALRKKPGQPPRGAPKVIVQAKAPAKAKAKAKTPAKAREAAMSVEGFKAALKASQPFFPQHAPTNGHDEATREPAPEPAPEPTPEPEPAPEPAAAKPDNLFSPLPKEGQPYELVITQGSATFPFSLHTVHTSALDLTRRLRCVVLVRDKAGSTVRSYDYAEIKKTGASKQPKLGRPFAKGGESKFARAARLLFREQGAKARELEKECGWVNVSQRYVNRASKLNDNATIETLGDKHWRLSKRK